MKLIGNILWILLGGAEIAFAWLCIGLVLCASIIGIPFGVQCFKMAQLTLIPFGQEVVSSNGVGSFIVNLFWALTFGWILACCYLLAGIAQCITVIGIPFGIQSFKMMRLAFAPFGTSVQ